MPRVGIATWQALGLAFGLALIGLPLALGLAASRTPPGPALARLAGELARGEPPAVGAPRLAAVAVGLLIAARLLWVTAACLVRTWRARRRHRELLALVGRADPVAPGALVLDHPRAAAYCLPGRRPTIVVSAGTLDLLRGEELAAVLCHERSHASERHDLVLLPFTALRRALPPLRWLRGADEAVGLLVEMRADDRARRRYPEALTAALRRFAATGAGATPPGALAAADRAIAIRVQRLQERRRPPVVRGALVLAVAWGLAAAPALLPVLAG